MVKLAKIPARRDGEQQWKNGKEEELGGHSDIADWKVTPQNVTQNAC